MKLQGKTAIVTGASAGLGLATAEAFAREGANVVMAARRAEPLESAAASLRKLGGSVLAVPTDVSQHFEVEHLVREALKFFGRVDLLVNNAAIDYPGPITELTVQQWEHVVGVNLCGVFYACKAVFPVMIRQHSGYIINISSMAGKKGCAGAAAYCATKFALTGFTQALAEEGKPHNIRCSVLYPGGLDTDWHEGRIPSEHLVATETVADFLVHMVTQDPRFVVTEAVVSPTAEPRYYP